MLNILDIKMLEDRVLLKRLKEYESEKKIGHILVPDSKVTTTRESKLCEVISVGKGKYGKRGLFIPNTIFIGQKVYCTRYGKEILDRFIDDDKYVVTREYGILANVFFSADKMNPRIVKPLFDNILVEELDASKNTKAGIILPDLEKDLKGLSTYKVLDIGQGRVCLKTGEQVPMDVKIGDIVKAPTTTGCAISWAIGNELKVFRLIIEKDILFIEN